MVYHIILLIDIGENIYRLYDPPVVGFEESALHTGLPAEGRTESFVSSLKHLKAMLCFFGRVHQR